MPLIKSQGSSFRELPSTDRSVIVAMTDGETSKEHASPENSLPLKYRLAVPTGKSATRQELPNDRCYVPRAWQSITHWRATDFYAPQVIKFAAKVSVLCLKAARGRWAG